MSTESNVWVYIFCGLLVCGIFGPACAPSGSVRNLAEEPADEQTEDEEEAVASRGPEPGSGNLEGNSSDPSDGIAVMILALNLANIFYGWLRKVKLAKEAYCPFQPHNIPPPRLIC